MIDPHAILHNTGRLVGLGMVGVCVYAVFTGNAVPFGALLASLVILFELVVLTYAVGWMNRALVHGGGAGLAMVALQGRFLITVLALALIAQTFSIHAVMAGVVLGFVAYLLSSLVEAVSMMGRPVPLESM